MDILMLPCFLLCFFLPITTATDCSSSACGNLTIRFPFRLIDSSPRCGHPGFELTCTAPQSHPALNLPGSGDFLVSKIDYVTQTIQLYDPGNCLPRRLLGFNLSSSPFIADLSSNYTLFSCPKELGRLTFPSINCLSNSTRVVLVISAGDFENTTIVYERCQKMEDLMVPGGNLTELLVRDGVELRWDVPMCGDCESSGGICFVDDQRQLVCLSDPAKGVSKKKLTSLHIFEIIALSISLPTMACVLGLAVCWCLRNNQDTRNRTQQAAVNPHEPPAINGLDQATIDSYSKVVLGESKRVPGHNGDTCHICLSDFRPNETLRCIPECQHCFHADCIDEWLRLKGSCPLCRKSPSPGPD